MHWESGLLQHKWMLEYRQVKRLHRNMILIRVGISYSKRTMLCQNKPICSPSKSRILFPESKLDWDMWKTMCKNYQQYCSILDSLLCWEQVAMCIIRGYFGHFEGETIVWEKNGSLFQCCVHSQVTILLHYSTTGLTHCIRFIFRSKIKMLVKEVWSFSFKYRVERHLSTDDCVL